jgi:hypothetical protein
VIAATPLFTDTFLDAYSHNSDLLHNPTPNAYLYSRANIILAMAEERAGACSFSGHDKTFKAVNFLSVE